MTPSSLHYFFGLCSRLVNRYIKLVSSPVQSRKDPECLIWQSAHRFLFSSFLLLNSVCFFIKLILLRFSFLFLLFDYLCTENFWLSFHLIIFFPSLCVEWKYVPLSWRPHHNSWRPGHSNGGQKSIHLWPSKWLWSYVLSQPPIRIIDVRLAFLIEFSIIRLSIVSGEMSYRNRQTIGQGSRKEQRSEEKSINERMYVDLFFFCS